MVSLRLSRRAAGRPGERRVGGIGAIEYPGTFLLGGDIAIQDPDEALEIANHFADLYRFP